MKRIMLGVALLGGLMFAPAIAGANQPEDLHCPDGGVKVEVIDDDDDETNDQDVINDLVLPDGTRVCVKAGPGNTGIVIADGEDTLQEILFDNGIIDGSGEQGKDVSYYVIYPPLLEAFICFEGEITVLSHTVQASLNLLVSVFLELNDGAVQVLSRDAECEEPTTPTTVPPTTPTTAPPVTPTTAPPATDTPVTAAPRSAAPVATQAPVSQPAPVTQLPRTGSGALGLLLGGLSLVCAGSAMRIVSKLRRAGA